MTAPDGTSSRHYVIEVANEQALPVDIDHLESVARRTLELEQVASAELSIALLDNAAIHELNRQYLDHDCPTDVISFLLECQGEAASPGHPRGAGKRLEGEILISVEMASEMACEYDWSAANELTLYLVHGLLHLCGYDDLTPEEQQQMRRREREVLATWQLAPHYGSAELDHPKSEPSPGVSSQKKPETSKTRTSRGTRRPARVAGETAAAPRAPRDGELKKRASRRRKTK